MPTELGMDVMVMVMMVVVMLRCRLLLLLLLLLRPLEAGWVVPAGSSNSATVEKQLQVTMLLLLWCLRRVLPGWPQFR